MIGSKNVRRATDCNQSGNAFFFFNQSEAESNSVLLKALPRLAPVGCFPARCTNGSFLALGTRWKLFLWGLIGSSCFSRVVVIIQICSVGFWFYHSREKIKPPQTLQQPMVKFDITFIFVWNSSERTTLKVLWALAFSREAPSIIRPQNVSKYLFFRVWNFNMLTDTVAHRERLAELPSMFLGKSAFSWDKYFTSTSFYILNIWASTSTDENCKVVIKWSLVI